MLLTILGCSGSVPVPGVPASGYLVEAEGFTLVLDLGNGTLAELQRHLDPLDLGALLLSHLHGDHCADVTALTVLRRYHPAAATRDSGRLPVFGPSDTAARLAGANAPNAAELADTDLSDVYEFRAVGPEPVRIGPFEVSARRVVHPCEAYGFRVTYGGRSLVYTGDSSTCDALGELAEGADVLLAEASWTEGEDRPPRMHMSGKEAGELATRAGAGRLVLTHVLPWADPQGVLAEAKAAYSGDCELATVGARYSI